MGSEQARGVLASFGDKHFAANIIKHADDPRVCVRAELAIEAMLSFATTAREQALREAINEVHMIMVATDVENATSEWFEALDHVADRLNSLLTKEPKA